MQPDRTALSPRTLFSPASLQVVLAFVSSRLLILLIIIAGAEISYFEIPAIEGRNLNPTIAVAPERIRANVARVLGSADANWYLRIARDGYDPPPYTSDAPHNWVFFPLFPLLVRLFATVIGSELLAAVVISNLALLGAMLILPRLAERLGFDEQTGVRASWVVALFPTSYFFSAPFTESLFLLVTCGAFLALAESRILLAGAFMACATAARPTGMLLLPAFAAALWDHRHAMGRAAVSILLASTGLLSYLVYLAYSLGAPLAFADNQHAWGRGKRGFGALCQDLFALPINVMEPWSFTGLHLIALLAAGGTVALFCKMRRPAIALCVVLPLAAALSTGELLSLTRFTMALFPIPIAIAAFASTPARERIVFAVLAALLGIMTALYAHHVTAAMT